jgi:hypothetical protein
MYIIQLPIGTANSQRGDDGYLQSFHTQCLEIWTITPRVIVSLKGGYLQRVHGFLSGLAEKWSAPFQYMGVLAAIAEQHPCHCQGTASCAVYGPGRTVNQPTVLL